MEKGIRSDKLFLEDIQTSMDRIAEYIEGYNFADFKKDNKTVDAVIRNFEIIGEASKRLTDKVKEDNPDIPWHEMYYLRNRVTHEYFGVDYEIIWDIIAHKIPQLKIVLTHLREKI